MIDSTIIMSYPVTVIHVLAKKWSIK